MAKRKTSTAKKRGRPPKKEAAAKRKPGRPKKKAEPKKRGRPRAIGEKQRTEILSILKAGGSISDAASIARVDRRTIDRECERNLEFRADLTRAGDECKMTLIRRVAGNEDWRAASWYLARKWPAEFSDAIGKQLSVNITPKALAEMSDDEIDSLIGRLERGQS